MSVHVDAFATNTGRQPDWWLNVVAADMRTAYQHLRAGETMIVRRGVEQPVTVWLSGRVTYLLHLAEHSNVRSPVCVGE